MTDGSGLVERVGGTRFRELTYNQSPENQEKPGEKCGTFALQLDDTYYLEAESIANRLKDFEKLVRNAFAIEHFERLDSKPLIPTLLSLFRQAIFDSNFAQDLVKKILESLNHRGPHGHGYAYRTEEGGIENTKYVGSLEGGPVFTDEEVIPNRVGELIGHSRYATNGNVTEKNGHPHYGWREVSDEGKLFEVYLSHNGNVEGIESVLKNRKLIKNPNLSELGHDQGDSDSALFAQAIAESEGENTIAKLKNLLPHIPPSYSCTMMTDEGLFAFRDSGGNRPLFLCEMKIRGKKSYIIASETVAFQDALARVGLDFNSKNVKIREIEPGEIVQIDKEGNLSTDTFLDKVGLINGLTETNPVAELFESLEGEGLTNENLTQENLENIISYLTKLVQELGTLPCFIEIVYFAFSSSRLFTNPIFAGGTGEFLTDLFEKLDKIIQVLSLDQSGQFTGLKSQIENLKSELEKRKRKVSPEQEQMLIREARKQIGAGLLDNPEVKKVLTSLGFKIPENEDNSNSNTEIPEGEQEQEEIPEDVIISYIPNGGKNPCKGFVERLIQMGILPKGFKIPKIFEGSTKRAFLAHTHKGKEEIAKRKFSIKKDSEIEFKDKTVVLLDDSLVRGTNVKVCIKNLLEKGVKKVVIISAAPILENGCDLGVALKKDQLLSTRAKDANQNQVEDSENTQTLPQKMAAQLIKEINEENGTSYTDDRLELVFGDIEGIQQVVLPNGGFCTGCLVSSV
jgi:glutamine phosphoribosylpyrophosphate amidotransferase